MAETGGTLAQLDKQEAEAIGCTCHKVRAAV
jgi:hypothetical protein